MLLSVMLGFAIWFVIRMVLSGFYVVEQNEREDIARIHCAFGQHLDFYTVSQIQPCSWGDCVRSENVLY